MRHKTKLLEFMGGDDRFTKGSFYNYNQIAEVSGVNISTLKNRLRFKYSFDGHSLTYQSKVCQNNYPVFDQKSEAVSAKWLKRRIV